MKHFCNWKYKKSWIFAMESISKINGADIKFCARNKEPKFRTLVFLSHPFTFFEISAQQFNLVQPCFSLFSYMRRPLIRTIVMTALTNFMYFDVPVQRVSWTLGIIGQLLSTPSRHTQDIVITTLTNTILFERASYLNHEVFLLF